MTRPVPTFSRLLGAALLPTLVAALVATGAAPATAAPADDGKDLTVTVATLNILGSQHTRGPDKKRTRKTARLIQDQRIALAGLQEVQADQQRWLANRLDGYRMWPGTTLGPGALRLQIVWRAKRFEMVDNGTITTTFSHQERPVPWVRLRDKETDRKVFVIDVHNSPQGQEKDRDSATRKLIRLYAELRERGAVVMLGDANEHDEWFCRVTRKTDARAANGGSHVDDVCVAPRPVFIDWIMGSGRFDWQDYAWLQTEVSDHRLHTATLAWHG